MNTRTLGLIVSFTLLFAVAILLYLGSTNVSGLSPKEEGEPVVCTMDAKQCPDGSFVGRVGPDCQFAACPSEAGRADSQPNAVRVMCREEARDQACTREFVPVCGLTRMECISAPCEPVPETYSNACTACSNERVVSYTPGACEE